MRFFWNRRNEIAVALMIDKSISGFHIFRQENVSRLEGGF